MQATQPANVSPPEEASAVTEFYFQWHITNKCNKRCTHCYHADYDAGAERELHQLFDAASRMEQAVSAWGRTGVMSLTGGEPFMRRKELFALMERMEKNKIFSYTDILTNGSMLTKDDCQILGSTTFLRRVQLSLEGSSPAINDAIRGKDSFHSTIRAIEMLKAHNVEVAVMMTLSRFNVADALPLLEVLAELEVDTFAFERFIPEGQAESQKDQVLSPEELKNIFSAIHDWGFSHAVPRVLMYRPLMCLLAPDSPYVGAMCSVGINALSILPDGTIFPCRRLPMPLGNILSDSLHDIWMQSPMLWQARTPSAIKGKCGRCKYLPICRGCRAQALAMTGDWLEEDPQCWLDTREWRLPANVQLGHPEGTDIFFAYNSVSGEQFELNETAYVALQAIKNAPSSVSNLVYEIGRSFEADTEEIDKDITELFGIFAEKGLVESIE